MPHRPFAHFRRRWLEIWLLVRQFRWPLLLFSITVLAGGVLYYSLSLWLNEPLDNLAEAIYLVLTLSFLQPSGEFPLHWQLEVFYFLMPLIGLALLAQGLADFGVMLFNRRMRNKEWQVTLASTFHHHVVLIGLGHLGFRVAKELHEIGKPVVVIELDPDADLRPTVESWGIPILQGDGTQATVLQAANVARAESIVLCSQNDAVNLQAALKARALNPNIRVVIRIFDDGFADALREQFGFQALSATGMSAPIFAATAANADITRPITIENTALSLARFVIAPRSALKGRTIGDIEQQYDVSVVRIERNGQMDMHPPANRILQDGDLLIVLGEPHLLKKLIYDNR